MKKGISTACLYPEPLEASFRTLTSMQFRTFEVFFNTWSEFQPSFITLLRRIAKEQNCRILSVHPYTSGYESCLLFSNYERRFLDSVSFYEEYFRAARDLGASFVVLHGQRDYQNSSISEEEYIDRYAYLNRRAKTFGVTLAQENVNRFRSEDPAYIRRMRRRLQDDCSFVFDIKQAVRAGQDPFEMCSAMGERLVHIHINDHTESEDCLLPGCGRMDYMRLLSMLRSFGYGGEVIIEVYRKNFTELQELEKARNFLNTLFSNY